MPKKTIGRFEIADFPEIGLNNVPVKIDTGAYTPSIHFEKAEETQDGLAVYFFSQQTAAILIPSYKNSKVRSSNGKLQKRFKIKTQMVFHGKKYRIEFTLAKRNKMRFPVLLGRKFLSGKFVVDTSLKYTSKSF